MNKPTTIIGITGSIGMGKSTASAMLETLGIPVHDSDASAHEHLRFGSKAWYAIASAFPYFSYPQIYGKKHFFNPFKDTMRYLKRDKLSEIIFNDDTAREKLESILHPFIQQSQTQFIKRQTALGRTIVALDIPLLFETGADARVDYTINVTAPHYIQRARVLARPNMTSEKFENILKRQMPDGEKSARADFILHSGLGRAHMMKDLKTALNEIRKPKIKNTKTRKHAA